MRCKTAQRKLEAYLGGELSETERACLEEHFASCAECARALAHARQLHRTLSEKTTPPLPTGFHGRLMARARKHGAKRSWGERILRPFGWRPAMPAGLRVAAAAAVVVALGLGVLIGRDMWRGQRPQETRAARIAEADPVRLYRMDYLAGAPDGSLTDAYANLVSTGEGE
ncbi:MAG: zf-HC2 domain-containing protein [Candidatus Brocadiia bacterium]